MHVLSKELLMYKFTTQSMFEILQLLQNKIDFIDAKEIVEFEVLNPDILTSAYAGTLITVDEKAFIYRGYKAWIDLAEILQCKMLTPAVKTPNFVIMRFQ
ncbi:MAG: methyltransferase, partial [Sulfurimonas sp.]|nr:methyltransferase [Sulfurimonas sp.]